VVEQLVGAEFFAAMARIFVMEQPPRSPILMTYGDAFPDFIAAFAPAAELFYLPDVARLEAARTRAYHAADVAPLAPAAFAATEPDDLAELRFVLHPSVEIVRSAHPIVTIWAMHSGEAKLGPIPDWRPQDALVARPRLDVEIRALPPGAAAFLIALRQGAPLEGAANAALAEEREFALAENLAVLIGSGLATDICRPTAKLDRP
jgi:hypothetical protein